jgi:Zn-dependent protease
MTIFRPRFSVFGCEFRFHWTWPTTFLAVAVYCLIARPVAETPFFLGLYLATTGCVILQEISHVLAARRLRIGTRDVSLYPFWGVSRLGVMSERPWQEAYIAATGPVAHILIAAIIGGGLSLFDQRVAFHEDSTPATWTHFGIYLFWANALLSILNCLPFLPLDAGKMFRGSLSMTVTRMRATDVAVTLSIFGAGLIAILGVVWLKSPLVVGMALLLYFSAQDELGTTRYFDAIRRRRTDPNLPPANGISVLLGDVVPEQMQPEEAGFNGFTWNPESRLWIEWRNGEAVAAHGLIGE